MHLAQLVLPDRETAPQPHGRNDDVIDPHGPQTLRVHAIRHPLLRLGQGFHQLRGRTRGAAAEDGRGVGGQTRGEGGLPAGHAVLEYDAADDDGDGRGDVPREAERRGRGRDILWFDQRLQRYQRGLKIRSHADAGDDLIDDDAAPARVVWEIDVETETEGHEEQSEPDGWEVLACFLDEDAHGGGDEGEGKDEGEGVDAAEDG